MSSASEGSCGDAGGSLLSSQSIPLDDPALASYRSGGCTRRCLRRTEVFDRIGVMRRQEESEAYAGVRRRRLPLPPSPLRQPTDGRCRTKMALWCYQVMDYCNLSRSTVELAMNLLDRFISTSHAMAYECLEDRSSYQLAAMTSLYTAVKTCEVEVMDPHIIATLSRGMCTEVDVVNMEQAILEAVGWRLCGPTASAAVDHLVQLLDDVPVHVLRSILAGARQRTQLAVLGGGELCSTARPTRVAYDALRDTVIEDGDGLLSGERTRMFLADLDLAIFGDEPVVDVLDDEDDIFLDALVEDPLCAKGRPGSSFVAPNANGNAVARNGGHSPRCISTHSTAA